MYPVSLEKLITVMEMAMMSIGLSKLSFSQILTPLTSTSRTLLKPARCAPLQQVQVQEQQADAGILCEPCNGKGWLLCDFCRGQKTNVKAENNRIYRRCPSCRAIGYVLCQRCKVFKCVTFPNYNDGAGDLSF